MSREGNVVEKTGEECEYWTADEKLANAIAGKKKGKILRGELTFGKDPAVETLA